MYVIVKNYYYMYLIIKIIFNCIIFFHFKRNLALLNLELFLVALLCTLNMYVFLFLNSLGLKRVQIKRRAMINMKNEIVIPGEKELIILILSLGNSVLYIVATLYLA